jgi:quinol monooxygenase YgiN
MQSTPRLHHAAIARCVAGRALAALTWAMASATAIAAPGGRPDPQTRRPAMTRCCGIFELRQYTTYPGKRDTLIALFERDFIESQEAAGIQLVAQFRDINDPNRFVWFRGFPDMPARATALGEFYTGPIWTAHREAANATLYDNDNVLLLHPARDGAGFALADARRAGPGTSPGAADFVVVTTYHFAHPVTDDFVRWFDDTLRPVFVRSGATVLAELVSEHSENTFPRLPVREGEDVFVWVARYDNRRAYDDHLARLAHEPRWSAELFSTLYKQLAGWPEVLMLEPTVRSLLGHGHDAPRTPTR